MYNRSTLLHAVGQLLKILILEAREPERLTRYMMRYCRFAFGRPIISSGNATLRLIACHGNMVTAWKA